jgi:hypothetical protein
VPVTTICWKAGVQGIDATPAWPILLKGDLPSLYGHLVIGGRQLTVTTPTPGIWQVGGIAERWPGRNIAKQDWYTRDSPLVAGTDLCVEVLYTPFGQKRASDQPPSGVHAGYVAPHDRCVATKLSCAGIGDEVFSLAVQDLKMPERQEETYSEFNSWPAPPLARYPWEDAEWCRVS